MMDGALVLITLVSLGTTAAVLLYAARLIRDERARSDARVAALAEEIARTGSRLRETERPALPAAPAARGTLSGVAQGAGPRLSQPERPSASAVTRTDRARVAADALGDRPLFPGRVASTEPAERVGNRSRGTLFESSPAPDAAATRWLVPAIGAAIVVLALATVYFVSGPLANGAQSATDAKGAVQAPLELVSLQHVRNGTVLNVSGVVRNPSGAAERKEVAGVVFLFGRDGSFLASGRAPLDYQALAPGDESPFTITVPDAGNVGRYRVSFRAGDDVLPHVDRRESGSAANSAAARP